MNRIMLLYFLMTPSLTLAAGIGGSGSGVGGVPSTISNLTVRNKINFFDTNTQVTSPSSGQSNLSSSVAMAIAGNGYADATNWYRYNTGAASSVLSMGLGSASFYMAAAGANPITWGSAVLILGASSATFSVPVVFQGATFAQSVGFQSATFASTVASTKACASGFTRQGPNLCMKTGNTSLVGLTRDALTTLTMPDASALGLIVHVGANVYSANSVLYRYATVYAYSDGGTGTAQVDQCFVGQYEFVATASTNIGGAQCDLFIPGITPSVKFADDAGNGGNAGYEIRGYWD
jgi:hypothetical protein